MRYTIMTVAVFALLAWVRADEFHLTDATGKQYGPFEFKQGETLSIAGQEYMISKVLTKEQKILEKMKAIVIPEIDFRQANVHDVIDFLQEASVEYDPKSEHRQRGVSAILNLGPPPTTKTSTTDPFEDDPFAEQPEGQHQTADVPRITFSARHVSLIEAMNIVCKICNLQWAIQDGVVMIEPKKMKEVQQNKDKDRDKDRDKDCGTPDMTDPPPHTIHVEGAVAKPGEYVLLKDARLSYGIASAGGYADSVSEISIVRNGKVVFRIDSSALRDPTKNNDPVLKNGDTIQVER